MSLENKLPSKSIVVRILTLLSLGHPVSAWWVFILSVISKWKAHKTGCYLSFSLPCLPPIPLFFSGRWKNTSVGENKGRFPFCRALFFYADCGTSSNFISLLKSHQTLWCHRGNMAQCCCYCRYGEVLCRRKDSITYLWRISSSAVLWDVWCS